MTKDEALRMALDVLVEVNKLSIGKNAICLPAEIDTAMDAAKEALAQPEQEPVAKYCCHLCFNKSGQLFLDRMILCPECGNKRCPKATHHELPCTNSNEPNQAGSVYTTPPQRTWVGLTADEIVELVIKHRDTPVALVDYVEAKLKEKNT